MTTKTKVFYLVTVFTPIKDGNHYTARSCLYECKQKADKYAAMFDEGVYITDIQEWHLPQH